MKSKTLSVFVGSLVAVLLVGCATTALPYAYKASQYDGFLLVARKVAVTEAGVNAIVQIDGRAVISLRPNEHCIIPVAPGQHRVAVKVDTGAKADTKDVSVASNQMLYFIIRPNAASVPARLIPLIGDLAVKNLLIDAASEEVFKAVAVKGKEQPVVYSR